MNQEKLKYQSLAFSKHTPTVFVVESPFQLLCAWNAIDEFEISEYKIILILEKGNVRNQQVFNMLQTRCMEYEVFYMDDYSVEDIIGSSSLSGVRYDRVFAGEILNAHILALCGKYASEKSAVVYMDDGAASIRVLTGHSFYQNRFTARVKRWFKRQQNHKQLNIKRFWERTGLHDYGFYYTIYADIKTHRFITYPNKMDRLLAIMKALQREDVILIIGAVTEDYSKLSNISIAEYEGILWRKMREVRQSHPQSRIIYIPHGRDNNECIKGFCDILNIEYLKIQMAVEYYVLTSSINVTDIYGFSSTALYTLRLMTQANVVNWLIKNKFKTPWYSINEIATYYKKHGIMIDEIQYPKPKLGDYCNYYTSFIIGRLKRR